jgi:transposase InsO family protein
MRAGVTMLLREASPLRRGDGEWLAGLVGRSSRALRTWASQGASAVGPGRPAHSAAARWRVLRAVSRQWKADGHTAGWRELDDKLPAVPTRLVQASLALLKPRRRRRGERRRKAERVHVEVHARDVLSSQDGTHLGRCQGRAVTAEVVKDVATMRTLDVAVSPRATSGADVIAMLEALEARGRLPLVWSTDNGSCYCSAEVETWLAEHRVVHLRSLPHTPQHNAWVERCHGELKAEACLGKGVRLDSVLEAEGRLLAARDRLDGHRLRGRLGARTALDVDRTLDTWEGAVERRTFYAAVCSAREQAVLGVIGARARRRAEREAVFTTLELYGLVTRTRGGAPLPSPKAEGIS